MATEPARIYTVAAEGKIPVWGYRPKNEGDWLIFDSFEKFGGSLFDHIRERGVGDEVEIRIGEMSLEDFATLEEHDGW